MSEEKWQMDLAEYIRLGEPEMSEKSQAWQIAIGLQQVDGLKTSAYLLDTAKEHIEGNITIKEAQKRIHSYYEQRTERLNIEENTQEADVVSARITELLGEKTFQFSPVEWQTIHRRLFEGVLKDAGKIRTWNITKKEWVLNGESVIYASCNNIKETIDYDFQMEKQFSYEGLSIEESIRHLVKFTSDIWQIHPFCEGNTRATAVFIIKYLRTFGLNVNNETFQNHSWYFRNALVRANYSDLTKGIHATTKYLEQFFSNLLLGTSYPLKNRYLHVDYVEEIQKGNDKISKGNICTLDCPLDELAILKLIIENPSITQKELAKQIKKSERTVKMKVASLREKGHIKRVNGKRNGKWEVLIDLK
ncbi:MAG: Fic family protein [Peptococcaceae bacterium]|nr:Fic family protein [Peptococcaceae bacterium]